MDDLDRLYHRLVLNIRDGAPHLLDRQFRLGDVSAHLVPYRHTRRELGFESIQQYELALLRLGAGERGYLKGEAPVQDALRRTLAEPQPDGALLRTHADAAVALPPDALVRARIASAEGNGDGAGTSPAVVAPAHPPTHAPASAVSDLERAFVASSQATDAWSEPARTASPPPAPARPTPTHTPSVAAPVVAAEPRPTMTNPTHHPAVPPAAATAGHPAGHAVGHAGGACRYCGQALPEGRRITFCPYCGNNVTVLQCPACSTELEVGWRFCITCGRAMDDAALAAGGDGEGASAGSTPDR